MEARYLLFYLCFSVLFIFMFFFSMLYYNSSMCMWSLTSRSGVMAQYECCCNLSYVYIFYHSSCLFDPVLTIILLTYKQDKSIFLNGTRERRVELEQGSNRLAYGSEFAAMIEMYLIGPIWFANRRYKCVHIANISSLNNIGMRQL